MGVTIPVLQMQAPRLREVGNSRKVTELENSSLEFESNFTSAILMVGMFQRGDLFFRFGSAVDFLCELREIILR